MRVNASSRVQSEMLIVFKSFTKLQRLSIALTGKKSRKREEGEDNVRYDVGRAAKELCLTASPVSLANPIIGRAKIGGAAE